MYVDGGCGNLMQRVTWWHFVNNDMKSSSLSHEDVQENTTRVIINGATSEPKLTQKMTGPLKQTVCLCLSTKQNFNSVLTRGFPKICNAKQQLYFSVLIIY